MDLHRDRNGGDERQYHTQRQLPARLHQQRQDKICLRRLAACALLPARPWRGVHIQHRPDQIQPASVCRQPVDDVDLRHRRPRRLCVVRHRPRPRAPRPRGQRTPVQPCRRPSRPDIHTMPSCHRFAWRPVVRQHRRPRTPQLPQPRRRPPQPAVRHHRHRSQRQQCLRTRDRRRPYPDNRTEKARERHIFHFLKLPLHRDF